MFGKDAQRSARSLTAGQDLGRVVWSAAVDDAPQYGRTGALFTHYGSPVISARNTVFMPVKTGATGGFRVDARTAQTGELRWSTPTDYLLPAPYNWTPSYNVSLSPDGARLLIPGAGGKLIVRSNPDSLTPGAATQVFFGASAYAASPATFDATVFINTPITIDTQGVAFFGFYVSGSNPAGLSSGFARVTADGLGTWVAAATLTGDSGAPKPATNSAPALSNDGRTLYVVANSNYVRGALQQGYLLALDSSTLALKQRRRLLDPATGTAAYIADDGTASPVIAPDDRVFFGVLESNPGVHNARGWLLQFDAELTPAGFPGSFGWDITPTVVPASLVRGYTGSSTYLIATKYNNYAWVGTGDGKHRLALLDPLASQPDVYSSATVMREAYTVLGPTPDPTAVGAVKEWCINVMALDVNGRSLIANNEDGVIYRWDLSTNTLSQSLRLQSGLGQAYTSTAIGPDGLVYAISNARLHAVGR